ncbi:MAG: CPBP family intramembrane metalloprotease [Candidatus Eremiobacteraeota bacterium]|nr:CPBP family intramembrane metalloprotease [Candidatus Eremiobacteraeota bacterium]MBV8354629.1 CPBP family intramembrane metalloprotease [Candidatus Eremiobacteraeota bacterium]
MSTATSVRPFPIWATLGTLVLAIFVGFITAIVVAVPTVLILGPAKNPGSAATNIIEAAFYLGGVAVLIPLLERISGRSLHDLGVRRLDGHLLGLAAGGFVFVLVLQGVYQVILTAFHQQNHVQAGFEKFAVHAPLDAVYVLVTGAIVAPICEELFFRATIFNALAERIPVFWAAVISGALFGGAHGDPVLFPVLLVFGTFQALIYRRSGNLLVPMTIHAANNGLFLSLMMAFPGFH